MNVKVTTDWHIGAKRSAGSTPQSNESLKRFMLHSLSAALNHNQPHLILGDLLDQFTIDSSTLFDTYQVIFKFLSSGQELAVLRGNHDYHPRNLQVSSFDLLMGVLEHQFPQTLTVARTVREWKQFILVPHLPNNELLNIEIDRLKHTKDRVIVFHANYDNFHAEDTLHSLNLSPEVVSDLVGRNNTLVLGHEHDHRVLHDGKLLILGNGVPSSIADCLGSKFKFSATFNGLDYELEPMLAVEEVFARVDWRDLDHAPDKHFIRVEGTASADEASEVVNAVAALRQRSNAFCISNAVKVDGLAEFDKLAEMSYADVTSFDVLECLLAELEPREQETVQELLK